MGLILWIDQNKFASALVERAFKKLHLPFYSIDSVQDFSYLVEDLNPQVIVLDGTTVSRNYSVFREQYLKSPKMQETHFIFLEPEGDLSFISKKIGEIQRPFDPFEIPKQISNMIGLN